AVCCPADGRSGTRSRGSISRRAARGEASRCGRRGLSAHEQIGSDRGGSGHDPCQQPACCGRDPRRAPQRRHRLRPVRTCFGFPIRVIRMAVPLPPGANDRTPFGIRQPPAPAVAGAQARRSRVLGARQSAKVDLLLLAVAVSILTYVWRVQDLYPILAAVKLPILASLAMYGLFVIDSDGRRKLKTIRHPVTICVVAIMALAVASVPTSLYQGLSFGFIKDDL